MTNYFTISGTEIPANETGVDEKGRRYWIKEPCARCGGAGGYRGWPGFTCFRCAGKGLDPTPARVYGPDEYRDRRAKADARIAKRQAKAKAKIEAVLQANLDKAPELVKALDDYQGDNSFLTDLRLKLRSFILSDKQIKAAQAALTRDAERAAELAARPTAPEGKTTFEGIVRKVDLQDSEWGSTWKMLVVLDDGNKIWSTVPKGLIAQASSVLTAIRDNGWDANWGWVLMESRVRVTATLHRKDDHFAIAKRPRADIIEYREEVPR